MRRGSAGWWVALSGLLAWIAATGWLDAITGADYGFSLFYLMPILAAAWWLGTEAAVTLGLAAAVAWYLADAPQRAQAGLNVSLWNGFTRLVIFCGMGLLAARVSGDRGRLERMLERERQLGRFDPTTGLPNRRGFIERLMMEASRCRRAGQPLCVAYLDLDNFKAVNDHYGHAVGDELLSRIGTALRSTIRSGDMAARLGGDEFAILFWNAERGAIEGIAQRVIERIGEEGRDYPDAGLGASVGIAHFAGVPDSVEEILRIADHAMYEAKAAGKGRLVVWRGESTAALT